MRTLSSNAPIALISPSISPVIPVLIDQAAGRSFSSAPPRMQVPPRTPKDRAAVAQWTHHPANPALKRRAAQAMAELEAQHKAKQQGATRWREAKEFAKLLEMADVVDIQTAAEQYTGKWDQDVVTGEYLDKNTQELAQALSKRQVPVVWNDLIREVERIRKRKNLSPLSASWHRNVGIAIKQCP